MKEILRYVIFGKQATKKNSMIPLINWGKRTVKLLPSKQFRDYQDKAGWYLKPRPEKPIDYPVNVKCLFHLPDRRVRDQGNLIAAVDDILVHYGILKDDKWEIVAGHDGTRCYVDKNNPRTEIYIEPVDLEEWYK